MFVPPLITPEEQVGRTTSPHVTPRKVSRPMVHHPEELARPEKRPAPNLSHLLRRVQKMGILLLLCGGSPKAKHKASLDSEHHRIRWFQFFTISET